MTEVFLGADFLNPVVRADCTLSPLAVVRLLRDIERSGGRAMDTRRPIYDNAVT